MLDVPRNRDVSERPVQIPWARLLLQVEQPASTMPLVRTVVFLDQGNAFPCLGNPDTGHDDHVVIDLEPMHQLRQFRSRFSAVPISQFTINPRIDSIPTPAIN